jgi:hypothetical protein
MLRRVALFGWLLDALEMFAQGQRRRDDKRAIRLLDEGTEPDRRAHRRQGRARHSGDARGNRCLDVGTRIDNGNLTALLHAQGIARNDFVEG